MPAPARPSRSPLALSAFMAVAGVAHFLVPRFYERIVPRWIGHERAVVAWSGVAELACAALVARHRTRRIGAWITLATVVAVYPANIQMALDAGRPRSAAAWAAWVRLPFQVPMIEWARRVATRAP